MDPNARLPEVPGEREFYPSPRRRGLNVLLAEDDAEMRHFLSAELRAAGHVVTTMCDGTEMIEALSELSKLPLGPPDAIIMMSACQYSGITFLPLRQQWSFVI
jgi:DNA-binding response OmpR family regulator